MTLKQSATVLFLILCTCVFSYATGDEDWEKVIRENKKVTGVESMEITKNMIELTGVHIKRVRIAEVVTNLEKEESRVVILTSDLEQAFLQKNKDIKEINITIKEDRLIAKGKANLLGMVMKVYLEGIFEMDEDDQIHYDILKARVTKGVPIPVPQRIIKSFKKRLNPIFGMDKLGIPIYVDKLTFEDDRIIID